MSAILVSQLVDHINASYGYCKFKRMGDEWRGNSPLRDSDSKSFAINAETGLWFDHVSQDNGNLEQLADKVGFDLPDSERHTVESSKRGYNGLADYATAHGVPAETLIQANWQEVTHHNRPALKFPTQTGLRYRFLDDQNPRYMSDTGYTACFYGLDRALWVANNNDYPHIILCNGEISTLTAQHWGLPAFCVTSGEKAIPDTLLTDLNDKWNGDIIIALDCDKKGRDTAQQIKEQLPNGLIVDMPLSDGGDLADFCKLMEQTSYNALIAITHKQNPKEISNSHTTDDNRSDRAIKELADFVYGDRDVTIRSFPFPITALRSYGGFMKNCVSGKVTMIGGGTGTGKTQFLETMVDKLNLLGVNGLWFGTEWSRQEMTMRRIQRYSGKDGVTHVTYDDIQEHLTYLSYEQRGMPDSRNFGTRLTRDQLEGYQDATDFIQIWDGTTEYFAGRDSLQETFFDMETTIERERRNNREIDFVVFDYLQLLQAKSFDKSVNRYEYAFELCKRFAEQYQVHIFMTTQMNKGGQQDSKTGGRSMGLEDAHFVRGDKANLFLILNRVYRKVPSQLGDAEWIETPCFWLTVAKSSLGGNNGGKVRIPLIMDYQHLKFIEPRPDPSNPSEDTDNWTQMSQFHYVPGNMFYNENDISTHIENIEMLQFN